jgi:hypothetical protein
MAALVPTVSVPAAGFTGPLTIPVTHHELPAE